MATKYTLAIHAGCEGITREYYGPEAEQEHLSFLRKSLAAGRAVLDNIRTLGGKGGLIAVDTAGRTAIAFTTRGMFRGLARQDEADRVGMFGPPGSWQ